MFNNSSPVQYLNNRSHFQNLASGKTQVKVSLLLDNSLKTRPQGMENFKKGKQGKGRLKHLKWEVGSQPGFTLKFN